MIKPNDHDSKVFDFLRQLDNDAGPIIDLICLNHKIYTSLHAGHLTFENILRLESKHASVLCFHIPVEGHNLSDGVGIKATKAQILTQARIHLHWFAQPPYDSHVRSAN